MAEFSAYEKWNLCQELHDMPLQISTAPGIPARVKPQTRTATQP